MIFHFQDFAAVEFGKTAAEIFCHCEAHSGEAIFRDFKASNLAMAETTFSKIFFL